MWNHGSLRSAASGASPLTLCDLPPGQIVTGEVYIRYFIIFLPTVLIAFWISQTNIDSPETKEVLVRRLRHQSSNSLPDTAINSKSVPISKDYFQGPGRQKEKRNNNASAIRRHGLVQIYSP